MAYIQIVDERGNEIKKAIVHFPDIIAGLVRINSYQEKYPRISEIDIYGDTFFNPIQLKGVVREFTELRDDLKNPELSKSPFKTNYPGIVTEESVLASLDELIKFAHLETHEYLKFNGD